MQLGQVPIGLIAHNVGGKVMSKSKTDNMIENLGSIYSNHRYFKLMRKRMIKQRDKRRIDIEEIKNNFFVDDDEASHMLPKMVEPNPYATGPAIGRPTYEYKLQKLGQLLESGLELSPCPNMIRAVTGVICEMNKMQGDYAPTKQVVATMDLKPERAVEIDHLIEQYQKDY